MLLRVGVDGDRRSPVPRTACPRLHYPSPFPPTPAMNLRPLSKPLKTQTAARDGPLCLNQPCRPRKLPLESGPCPLVVCACMSLWLNSPVSPWCCGLVSSCRDWQAHLLSDCEVKPPGSLLSEALEFYLQTEGSGCLFLFLHTIRQGN